MSENENGFVVEIGLQLLEDADPVFNHRSCRLIDVWIFPVEDEITTMHHVCFLKMDDAITIGVSRTPILNINGFIAYGLLPSIFESYIRIELICLTIILN